jgi:uncharacterized protein with PIN domain
MNSNVERRFVCAAMLGGLAPWLRAAGYDSSWSVSIGGPDLERMSQAEGRKFGVDDRAKQRLVLAALEARNAMLGGTIRDHVMQQRRPIVLFRLRAGSVP